MQANIITLSRIIILFITIGLFQLNIIYLSFFAFLLVPFIIYLDALDGYIAKKLKVASDFGALFDIAGDRIVESSFWIYFSVVGMINFWIPIIVITRDFLVDTVRTIEFREGKTAFGKKTMMKSSFTRFLVASGFSRTSYAVLKGTVFTFIGFLIFLNLGISNNKWLINSDVVTRLYFILNALVFLTLFLCIARGLPVLWDGREILFKKIYPRKRIRHH